MWENGELSRKHGELIWEVESNPMRSRKHMMGMNAWGCGDINHQTMWANDSFTIKNAVSYGFHENQASSIFWTKQQGRETYTLYGLDSMGDHHMLDKKTINIHFFLGFNNLLQFFGAPGGHLFAFYTQSSQAVAACDGGDALQDLRGTGGCPSRARRLRYTDDARRKGDNRGN